ncbi:hypothetical protein G7046_g6071 [Stylonectria norvegica]|nr:hypothetical protein G7046_g6071 [Stylonectria norvegica]
MSTIDKQIAGSALQQSGETTTSIRKESLHRLPMEVLREICQYLCGHCTEPFNYHGEPPTIYQSLLNLCLASRLMKDAAQPVLFHIFSSHPPTVGQNATDRMKKFIWTVGGNQYLARTVKHLTLDPNTSITIPEDVGAPEGEARFEEQISRYGIQMREQFLLCEKLLLETKCLEELSLTLCPDWDFPSSMVVHHHLTRLHLNFILEDWFYDSNGFFLDSSYAQNILSYVPNVEELVLTGLFRVDTLIWNVFQNVRRLHIESEYVDDELDKTLSLLSEAMPKLECLEISDGSVNHRRVCEHIRGLDLMQALLPRKNCLKSIKINMWASGFVDFALIREFKKLECLDLACKIDNVPPVEDGRFLVDLPSILPPSLKTLKVTQSHTPKVATFIACLSTILSGYPQLRWVEFRMWKMRFWRGDGDFQDRIYARKQILDGLRATFVTANAEQNYREAGVKLTVPWSET